MDRVLQSTPATASVQFTTDGVAADPGVVTIGINREDGTSLVAAGTATSGSGTNPRTFALTTTHTASLDRLVLTWTSGTLGVITTYVEVVGGFLFSIADARALAALSNTTTYPTANIVGARTAAETALEEACGVAFVPRYERETRTGNWRCDLIPRRPRPLSLQSVTLNGSTITDAVIDDETPGSATFFRQAGWPWNPARRNVVIKYTHGYSFPPPRVGIAALKLAKFMLVDSPTSERATNHTGPDGTVEYFITAGVRQAVFSIPECNACVQQYGIDNWPVA